MEYSRFTSMVQWVERNVDTRKGIFGDLMLHGIACGIKKILLIFNTSLESPHEPIYIINPSDFDVRPDTEIPITLAYNMVHYESMEPCSNEDIVETIKLVDKYQTGKYPFTRNDIPFLLGINQKQNIEVQDKIPMKANTMLENSSEDGDNMDDILKGDKFLSMKKSDNFVQDDDVGNYQINLEFNSIVLC